MAKIIWTEPALRDLDAIAEYIALDKPSAASRFVGKILSKVDKLELYPKLGKKLRALPEFSYREIIIPPCRIFYRISGQETFIIHVVRDEKELRTFMLNPKNQEPRT